jgi:drug/metabolite transporter (DMT)-like permease
MGAIATVFGYLLWNRGVQQIGPSRAGPFMHLMVVFIPVLSIVFLDESLHWYQLLGVALILGGVQLTSRRAGDGRPVT